MSPEPASGRRRRALRRRHSVAATLALLIIAAGSAQAHTSNGDYTWNMCFGTYRSDPFNGFVEAMMNDAAMSSSIGKCKASQVVVRLKDRDNTWQTLSDYDSLMPLGVEVAAAFRYLSYSQHKSKEPDNTWWTLTVNHGHS